jgi:cell division protein ZapA
MPQVNVTISGRTYRMACGEGEEGHLEDLAAALDAKIAEMREAFGEIGDMRLHVMAAITLADELAEVRRRVASLEEEVKRLSAEVSAADSRSSDLESHAAETVVRTAERIERLARGIGAIQSPAEPSEGEPE